GRFSPLRDLAAGGDLSMSEYELRRYALFVASQDREYATMKAFAIAMLAFSTALLLAALFWPEHSQPAFQPQQPLAPIAAKIETTKTQRAQPRRDRVAPQPKKPTPAKPPAMPTTTVSVSPSTDIKPRSTPSTNTPAIETSFKESIEQQLTSDEEDTFKQT